MKRLKLDAVKVGDILELAYSSGEMCHLNGTVVKVTSIGLVKNGKPAVEAVAVRVKNNNSPEFLSDKLARETYSGLFKPFLFRISHLTETEFRE